MKNKGFLPVGTDGLSRILHTFLVLNVRAFTVRIYKLGIFNEYLIFMVCFLIRFDF